MSMFDIVRNNKRITQVFLVLITLPFAFWGVESYVRNSGSSEDLATVGDSKISLQEYQVARREQLEMARQQLGKLDPAVFDTPQMRRAVLDSMITQRLLAAKVREARMSVSDQQLVQFISTVPSLQENGKFSKERYAALVAGQGMSKEMFEMRLRTDLAMQQLSLPVSEGRLPGQSASSRWMATQLEQREISEAALVPEAYVKQVKLAADAAQKHYDANRKQYELPEQVRAEYLVLSRDELAAQATPSEEEVKAAYKAGESRLKTAESRRASHILIKAAAGDDEKAAREKAEGLLAQVRKNPADFARLAKQHSQDPGSAENGGDLDWFGRGAMVRPFEDAVFSMQEGQVSDLVRTDFGFHVIRLTGIRGEHVKPLAEVRAELVAELKRDAGAKRFNEIAEAFGNVVYEQSDSLRPAAEKWNLTRRQSPWLGRNGKLEPPFDNARLAQAIFSDDAVKNGRNTDAVEIASGVLVAARVLEHKPAALQPFAAVKTEIEAALQRQEAARLAIEDGAAKLARLQKGETVVLKWGPAATVRRADRLGLAEESLRAIFAADATRLPAYVGTPHPGRGFAIYRIGAVKAGNAKEDPRAAALLETYSRAIGEEEFAAWLATLRRDHPVKINAALLEAKDR